MKTTKIK